MPPTSDDLAAPRLLRMARRARYDLGATVYLRCRDERLRGIVTDVRITPGDVVYAVTWGNGCESTHYALELAAEYTPDFAE